MSIISTKHIKYKFIKKDENNQNIGENIVLDDVNIDMEQGEFVAILGHNGSGKSTLARHLNALLLPDEGNVYIDGKDSKSVEELWTLREKCGMVFQNPDNQIVGVTVEEDIGFGPENLGIECNEIWSRVNDSLQKVDMNKYRKKSPNHLSGGQKQRVAIASSLAMKPKCIVFDEPTAMLDPQGRKEVMKIIRELNELENMTIILITHHMNEAVNADRVMVIDDGKIVLQGTPREVFSNVERIRELKLDMPQIMELSYELFKIGRFSRYDLLNAEEFVRQFEIDGIKTDTEQKIHGETEQKDTSEKSAKSESNGKSESIDKSEIIDKSEKSAFVSEENSCKVKSDGLIEKSDRKKTILELKNVNLSYESGTNMEVKAISDISLTLYSNEFIGIIGHTGSGKSSFVQLMNGLIKPTSGEIIYRGENIHVKGFDKKSLHCNIGLVFQCPESQLFEETVIKDVMFGPLNKGMSEEEAKQTAKDTLRMLDIGEKYYDNSPFELSGGEKRRVAIAGVIAMNPEVIILDEPTAGLDPRSRNNLLKALKVLRNERHKTIIIVSHNMEDMANYVERLIVMNDGKIMYDDNKKSVFKYAVELEKIGLDVPEVTAAMIRLKKMGYEVDTSAITIEEALRGMSTNA